MPIYEFKCSKCGEQFEQYRPLTGSDETVKCPKCGADHPKRHFSFYSPKSTYDSCSTSSFKST